MSARSNSWRSVSEPAPRGGRGTGSAEMIVGAAVSLGALLAGLALLSGLARLGAGAAEAAERDVGARWALGRMVREASRAGIGVCPGGEADCPDEAVELLETGVLAIRGDLDRDDPERAAAPESLLAGRFARVDTANDEVVVFAVRPAGVAPSATFMADMDGTARATLADGTPVARRDGVVEEIDAGPAALDGRAARGTLYRISFVDDARLFGTSRFRVAEPLLDGVEAFRVEAFDAEGRAVAPCGGADDAASRACRAAVRRIRLSLTVAADHAAARTLSAEVALPRAGDR